MVDLRRIRRVERGKDSVFGGRKKEPGRAERVTV